jgi:hypothetical protein
MIPNHAHFMDALQVNRKVRVRFYSKADSGVLDRVCAPLDYGLGGEMNDGLDRHWVWDYASDSGSCTLGLVPQQIVSLQVLGEVFDPAQIKIQPTHGTVFPTSGWPPAAVGTPGLAVGPKL